ncbi:MAG: SDR family oxidoreductase [Pseudomonadota bacterium]
MKTYTLITGASQGIGEEFARLAAEKGHNLIISARNEAALNTLAQELSAEVDVVVLSADLSEPSAAQALWEAASEGRHINRLINNAGYGLSGPITAFTADEHDALLEVNVGALTRLSRFAIGHMQEAGGGKILNVASLLAYLPAPYFSTYGASKSYVLAFSEALSKELSDSTVSVTALCPGPTETGFFDRAQMDGTKAANSAMQSAADVARIGWDAMEAGRTAVVPGSQNRLLAFATRFAPRNALASTAAQLFSKP